MKIATSSTVTAPFSAAPAPLARPIEPSLGSGRSVTIVSIVPETLSTPVP